MSGLADLCLSILPKVTPETLWRAWSLAPWTVLPLTLALALYGRGLLRLGRTGLPVESVRVATFIAGWLLLAVALVSPLCRLSGSLASAHMVQHVILSAAAPPLLVFAMSGAILSAALPKGRMRLGGSRASAVYPPELTFGAYAGITALYGAAIWLWHLPAVYDAVLRSAPVHVAAYMALILVSLTFWSATARVARSGSAGAAAIVIAMLVTTIHTGFLGALLTLSPVPWFDSATGGAAFGLDALADQQLAGLIMWVPMAGIYLAAGLIHLFHALDGFDGRGAPAPASNPA